MRNTFHQTINSVGESIFNIHTFSDYIHNLHFHKSFEIACVTEAEKPALCTVGKHSYSMKKNDFVMILPYEIHSFVIPKECKLWIIVFSADHAKKFSKIMSDKRGESPFFRCTDETLTFVRNQLIDKISERSEIPTDAFEMTVKSCLYAMCHDYLEETRLIDKGKGYDSITGDILEYISKHFDEDISLKGVAEELKYNYQYLSRIFNRTMGVNFKTLVNHYRFDYAKQMLTETDRGISDIAFESGFQSIRTFNRICFEISGKTPNAIRNRK